MSLFGKNEIETTFTFSSSVVVLCFIQFASATSFSTHSLSLSQKKNVHKMLVLKIFSSELQWWWDNFIFLYSHEMNNTVVCSSLKIIVCIFRLLSSRQNGPFLTKSTSERRNGFDYFIFLYVLEYCNRSRTPADRPVWNWENQSPLPSVLWNSLKLLQAWFMNLKAYSQEFMGVLPSNVC